VPDGPMRSPLFSLASMAVDRDRIEVAIHEAVRSGDPYLTEIASHLVLAGGKRLRPAVAIAAAQVRGTPASDEVVRGGVACELVHLGSLYHDDVLDEADTRRGVETVNAKWGNLQAILAGDFLLSRASEIAASLGTEVAGLLARTIGWLCEGEIEQLRHLYDVARPEESYYVSIQGKTASLYGTAARIGGIVAGLDRPTIDALTAWGNAFGMVFQIVDDILDVTDTTDHLGKPAGHDMVEGVYTLPVLRTLVMGGGVGDELASLLGRPLDVAERDKALDIVRANEGVESAAATARRYVAAAQTACDDLPPGAATDALLAAPGALLESVTSPAG
jgi:heptaprenyl diphosphate synthase